MVTVMRRGERGRMGGIKEFSIAVCVLLAVWISSVGPWAI